MTESKKEKTTALAGIPQGIKELIAAPAAEEKQVAPSQAHPVEAAAPAQEHAAAGEQKQAARPRTEKETELDGLIANRQAIIEQLKQKNPLVVAARAQLAELMPAIHGRGSGQVMGLVREEERLEFSIATEAYTPKHEKELLKRLRDIRSELSKHKELDIARKKVDEQRAVLRSLISDIRSLEHSLAEARQKCDEKYAEVLAERKAARSQRAQYREERPQIQRGESKKRGREGGRKNEYDEDISKYLKDYDDTVSMDEIVQIERKDRKEKKSEEKEDKGKKDADNEE